MSAVGTIESAVHAVKAGAEDFFKKPFVLEQAALALERTLQIRRVQRRNVYHRQLIHRRDPRNVGQKYCPRAHS